MAIIFRNPTGARASNAFNQVLKNEIKTNPITNKTRPIAITKISGALFKNAKVLGSVIIIEQF